MLSQDRDKGRVALSTRKLERTKGDMLRDPQKARALSSPACHASYCSPPSATEYCGTTRGAS